MRVAAQLRRLAYEPRIARAAAQRARCSDAARRAQQQLGALNREWLRIRSTNPYHSRVSREAGLPQSFSSLSEFVERVPVVTRASVQAHLAEMTCNDRPPEFFRITGGSTSVPVQLPAWHSETRHTLPSVWLGRSWYGVTPASRFFLIWGHSHLLGTGWRRRVRAAKGAAKDALLGYYRFPAYDLRPPALRRAAQEMIAFRPDVVIGYSVALDLFARACSDLTLNLRKLALKAVIATAESFPQPDSAERLSDLFGAPVAMEYGAVETSAIAHTQPSGGYEFFWENYLADVELVDGERRLRLTSLYPRCFPLVRYEIGDTIELDDSALGDGVSLFSCARVVGRCNDTLPMPDGAVVHSEAFSHVMKPCSSVQGFQIVADSPIVIRYVAPNELSASDVTGILSRLTSVHPALAHATLERAERLEQTVAGKTRMIVRG